MKAKEVKKAVDLFLTGEYHIHEIADQIGVKHYRITKIIQSYLDQTLKARTRKVCYPKYRHETEDDLIYQEATWEQLLHEMPSTIIDYLLLETKGEKQSHTDLLY